MTDKNRSPADFARLLKRLRVSLRSAWPGIRRFLLRLATLFGAFVAFTVVLTAGAAWYTSRSEFCNSCHIMEPYYDSWVSSTHNQVACIDCHFEPGFGGKFRGKLQGLVQLAKYLTKSEGPRPAAEISDASCLRSGCHETRLLAGKVEFDDIHFDHAPHMGTMRREKQLRCTSCHSQIVQGQHMSVTKTTCYLCHFKDEPFNQGLAGCTHCHQIPDKEYDLGGGVMFNHDLAYKRGVDCANCHSDVIRGRGEVPRERCLVCHNREGDIEQIKDAVFMHAKHVTEHKIDCLDCHLKIEHSLDPARLVHAASDCAGCHPNHHTEQIAMFEGRSPSQSRGPSPVGEVGGMTVARIGCRSCHQTKEVSLTGTVVWKASAQVCAMCHDPAEVGDLRTYHEQLRAALPEIQAGIDRARQSLKTAGLSEDLAKKLGAQVESLHGDLEFLRKGNDIHNIHYASKLSRGLADRVSSLARELKQPEPKIPLPPPLKKSK